MKPRTDETGSGADRSSVPLLYHWQWLMDGADGSPEAR